MISRKLIMLLALMLSAFLCAVPAFAAQEPATGNPGSDADAMALLMKMGDFLAQAKQFSVSIRAGYDVLQETGQMIEFGELRKLTLVRPHHIRADAERSDGEKVLVLFDGKEITVFSPEEEVFASTAKPGDLDNAILHLRRDLQLRLPLAMMFVTNFRSELERRVRSVQFVELTTLMDVPCVHLAVRTNAVDFQIWIPSEGDPLPRRVVITYREEEGQPQYGANFSEWNLAPNPPESFFSFTPPEGVQRIPFLAELEVAKPNVEEVKKGGEK
jgi:hypothetical protein